MSSLMGGTLDSTVELMSEMTKLTRILVSLGSFGDVQDEFVKRANMIIDEMEKFCVLFKKDCILFDDISIKSLVEKMEFQDELIVVKKERDDLREEVTRLKEGERKAREWTKMIQETLAKDCEEHSHMINEKSDMISELNVKVTNLNNQVLEKDAILFNDLSNTYQAEKRKFQDELLLVKKERDDFMEKLTRLKGDKRYARKRVKRLEERLAKNCEEQSHMRNEKGELNVKVTKLNNQVLEKDEMLNKFRERLKCMEVEVAQKEQEVNDMKHQKSAAYQSMEERLKNQVLFESNQILNAFEEKLKLLELKVLQKEQEVIELNRQESAANQINEESLKNQVLEKDEILNECLERLKCMEVELAQKDKEINDLKHQKSAAYQSMVKSLKNQILFENDQMLNSCKEKLRLVEIKVLQKEQELNDFKHQRIVAYQINEKKLKNQVLEKDETLNTCRERLKIMDVEVAQKKQEVDDLNHQKTAAYKIMEERLEDHVLESDQLSNTCKERLKFMKAKVLQLEQELHDFKHQNLASFQISKEKLKFMEVKVVQNEQEVRDLNYQKLAAYQIIKKLTRKQTEANQREQELRLRNVEASENAEKLKQLLLAVERDMLSDGGLKDIKEKQLEVDKNLEELRRKNMVVLRAVERFKEWMLAADKSFEQNKERWEGLPRIKIVEDGLIRVLKVKVLDLANSVLNEAVDVNSPIPKGSRESLRTWTGIYDGSGDEDDSLDQVGSQSHSSPPEVETSCSADIEKGTEKSHYSGCGDLLAMSKQINEGGGNGDGRPDQAVLQIPNSSPRVEANGTDREKGTDWSQGSGPVQFPGSDVKARPGEWDYTSDLPATVKGKISELPCLSLVTFSLRTRKRRLSWKAVEDILNKRQKKEQTQKPSHERSESISLKSSSKTPNPVLRSCKEKVVDSEIEIIDVDSSSDGD